MSTKQYPPARFKWQAKGPRRSEGTVDRIKHGGGPWPIGVATRRGRKWLALIRWEYHGRGTTPPKLPEEVLAEDRDAAREVAGVLLQKAEVEIRKYHDRLEARRRARDAKEKAEREERERLAAEQHAIAERLAAAHPDLLDPKRQGYTHPHLLVDGVVLARLLLDGEEADRGEAV